MDQRKENSEQWLPLITQQDTYLVTYHVLKMLIASPTIRVCYSDHCGVAQESAPKPILMQEVPSPHEGYSLRSWRTIRKFTITDISYPHKQIIKCPAQ